MAVVVVVTVMQSIVSGPSQCQSEREKNVFVAERKAGQSLAARGAATERRMGQTVTGICAKDNTVTATHCLLPHCFSLSQLASQSVSASYRSSASPAVSTGRVRPESVWVE